MSVLVRLLGPVEVLEGSRPVHVGHARQQAVLAVLLLEANHPVSADQLVDRVWGERPPQRARGTLHSYVSRLRAVLAGLPGIEIARRPGGYVLSVEPAAMDLTCFRALVRRATAAGRCEDVERLLAEALALWRGEALAGVESPWVDAVREQLAAERHAARLDHHDALMQMGGHARLVPVLTRTAEEHPWDERVAGQLMLALYRSGRPADALEVFRALRVRLVEQLGTDPGSGLRDLHHRILRADAGLDPPQTPAAVAAAAVSSTAVPAASLSPATPVPRQLPYRPRPFVGRDEELGLLDATLGPGGDLERPALVVISGGGGLGKTWLALRWAADHGHRFPDGVLYADLAGFDPVRDPVDPGVTLGAFLEALGVDPGRIPTDRAARCSLYRSLTATRRMLVVLDNARDGDAVEALLPGAGECRVLVTSRRRPTGLTVSHGATILPLASLPDRQARELVRQRLSRDLRSGEEDALAEVAGLCGGLPLALSIVASRAAGVPQAHLSQTAAALRDEASRLDLLDTGEVRTNLRVALETSRHALSPSAAAAFDLVGVVPGPELGLPALASLARVGLPAARTLADELVAAGLLHEAGAGRYRMHDLVRLYAAERAGQTGPERDLALERLLEHYVHTSHAAELLLAPRRVPLALGPPPEGVLVQAPADPESATDWFDVHLRCLVAAVVAATVAGLDVPAHRLAWTLATFCGHRRRWQEWAEAQQAAVASTRRCGDLAAQAEATRLLGQAFNNGHRFDLAEEQYRQAAQLFGRLGDLAGQAHVEFDLGLLLDRQHRPAEALVHAERSLETFRAAGDTHGVAVALNALGWYHCELGDLHAAVSCCQQALDSAREIGSVYCESNALDSLGYAFHQLGQLTHAIEHYEAAIALLRDMGDRVSEAIALDHLGDSHQAAGDPASANGSWQQSLAVLDELGHPDADRVRAKVRAAPERAPLTAEV